MSLHSWGSSTAGAGTFLVPGPGSATDSGEDDLVIGQPGDENRVRMFSENNDAVPLCWFFGSNQSDNASAPHNQVWNQGWNCDANGAAAVNTEHVARFSIESNYLTGGNRFMEWHWQSADGAGANARRGVSMSKNRGDHTLDVVLNGDISVFDSTAAQQRIIIQDSTGGTTNFIINSCAVLFNMNNANILQCLNNAGTQYVVMASVSTGDRVNIGGTNGTGVALIHGSTVKLEINSTGIGFFATAPIAKQTSGANLTNNVTSGGVDDTITNWTNLSTYSTDAAAIRNAAYQLARKLKQVNDALRAYGILT